MGLHRLTDITIGVPNVDETARYYTDFGLTPAHGPSEPDGHRFRSVDGGPQLRIVHRPARHLLSLGVGAEDPDDIDRISASLAGPGLAAQRPDAGRQAA